MKKYTFILLALLLTISCSSKKQATTATKQKSTYVKQKLKDNNTFVIKEISTDKTYGYSEDNAIEVGGVKDSEGPQNERRYLNALTGPNGEKISYKRKGSCCQFKTENGIMGGGMMDMYEVSWENSNKTVTLYINMYDSGILKAPYGFGIKK